MSYLTKKSEDPPEFEIGDEVEFELSKYKGSALPRWDSEGKDNGGSNRWAQGTVEKVDAEFIYIEYEFEDYIGIGQTKFPYVEHENYSPWQWKRRGMLRKIFPDLVCECGSEAVYGPTTGHSFWCDKYKKSS